MLLLKWIKEQIEFIKSFFSEPPDNSGAMKGSSKRLLSFLVVLTFIIPYWKVSLASNKLEDVPEIWALLIASILGLNIIDWVAKGYINKSVNNKTNGESKQ